MQNVMSIALFASSLLSTYLFAYLTERKENVQSLHYLSLSFAFTAWWEFWNGCEYIFSTFKLTLLAINLEYISIPIIPVLWFAFGRSLYSEKKYGRERKPFWAIWLVPAITSIIVWFDPVIGFVHHDIKIIFANGVPRVVMEYGPWFWFMWINSLIFTFLGTIYIFGSIFSQQKEKTVPVMCLAAGSLIPVISNFMYVLMPTSSFKPDLTPLSFCLTGLLLMLNIRSFNFLPSIIIGRKQALEELHDAIMIFDTDGMLLYANPAAIRFLKLKPEYMGKTPEQIGLQLKSLCDIEPGGEKEISVDGVYQYEARSTSITKDKKTIGKVISLYDITTRIAAENELKTINHDLEMIVTKRTKELADSNTHLKKELDQRISTERQLMHIALHDPLTELPNKSLLMNRIEQAIAKFQRDQNCRYGILFLDIDDFKQINDTYGHNAGDLFLREIAARLLLCVREIDTAARFGGDEFVILVDGFDGNYNIMSITERIHDQISIPFNIESNSVISSASIGILLCSDQILTVSDALRNADIAMYNAKNEGKNKFVVFDTSMLVSVLKENKLTQDLRAAIINGEIRMAFQPIIRMDSESVIGWEVLARWQHHEFGLIGPDRFIPIAEASGLIIPLGTFIIIETLRAASRLQKQYVNASSNNQENFFFAVNISAIQLQSPDFTEFILSAIDRFCLPPSCLHIELTESAFMGNFDTSVKIIRDLAEKGIYFTLDDFGTGYSSLAYLDRIPFESIKIDKSFIDRIDSNGSTPSSDGIIRGIISLSHELGKTVVSEGIETREKAVIIKNYGCDFGQGYLYGKPADENTLYRTVIKSGE